MHAPEWRAKSLRPMLAAGPACRIVYLFIVLPPKIKLLFVSSGTPLSPSRVILLGFCTRSPVLRKEYGANTVLSEIEIAVELRWVRDAADLLRVGAERFDERLEQRHREHAVAREIVVIRFPRVERFVVAGGPGAAALALVCREF